MDIQVYIQSGVIESYVLGMATDEEISEVERLRKQHPEIQQAIDDFSLSIEQEALANAMPPPLHVKEKILRSLSISPDPDEKKAESAPDAVSSSAVLRTPVRKLNWRVATAASIILLAGSVASNVYLYNRYTSTSSKYQALLIERNSLQASNNVYQTKLKDWQTAAEMMADSSMAMVKMPAAPGRSNVMATVFWDKNTKDVYVMANKLPPPSPGRQYQLWALVDGKPVDAGMLDPDATGIFKMKNIPKAQAFAITLEQKGGSPSPDMEQMYVFGNV